MLEPRELLESIMIDFGLDPAGRSKPLMLRDLSQYLVDQRLAGRLVLLVIDEAQNLGLGSLEELRMLSNLETEKSKLLQIVLVGQPNLRDKLAAPELEQLRQRITVSYHLPPLDADETGRYVNHRLRRAALAAPIEFPRAATDLIHARSRGVPRIINVICDAALVFGYAEERRIFDEALIADVLEELETTGVLPAVRDTAKRAESNPPAVRDAAASATSTSVAGVAATTDRPGVSAAAAAVDRGGSVAVADAPAAAPVPVPVPVPAPAVTRAESAEIAARALVVEQREQSVRQREMEIAEQRRVLAEEYRLLRARSAQARPEPAPAVRHVAPAARFEAAHDESFWGRVKRIMLGVSAS